MAGLIPEDDETQTPIASPIADTSGAGAAVKVGYGAGLLRGGAASAGIGYGAGILSGRTAAPDSAPAAEQGDFSRGLSTSFKQGKQALYGVKAFVGDAVGSDSMRDSGLQKYQEIGDEIAQDAKSSDSFSQAWEDGDLIDFAQYGAGYVVGQAAEALATGGIGGFLAKSLAKGALKKGLESALTKSIEKKIAAGMGEEAAVRSAFGQLGAGTALGGFNLTQELGQIYPAAVEQAQQTGEDPNLLRVFGSSVLAAAIETVADKFNLDKAGKVISGAQRGSQSLWRNAAKEAFVGGLREGGTEFVQTGIERWGASQELDSPEAIRDYVDSAALGVLGGGMFGTVAGAAKRRTPAEAPQPVDQAPVEPTSTTLETDTGRVLPLNQPQRTTIEVDETLREKYAPDLEARGIDPNSVEGTEAIQRLEAVERATGVIRAREAEKERSARQQEVQAAFGDTATSGVGVGVGGAEPVLQRESVMPIEGDRVLEPVGGAPESVILPEPSWMQGETAKTEAIAPEDVIARQQDWEAPEAFDFSSRSGEPSKVANRFVSEAQAIGFAKKYALNTRETQFQIRQAQRAKSEGGGKYYFIEERPLQSESHELVVGLGTREALTSKNESVTGKAAAVPESGSAGVEPADWSPAAKPATGQERAGDSVSGTVDGAGTPPALTRNFGKKRVTFPDVDHVETFGHGREAPKLPVEQGKLRQLEEEQAQKPTKKRAAEIEEQRKVVDALTKKVEASRKRARKAFNDTTSTDQDIDQRAVEYNTQVRAHAAAEKGDQVIRAKRTGEYTKAQETKVDQPAPAPQNEVHDAHGQPYTQRDRDFVASVQENFRKRFKRPSLVLDVVDVPEGSRGRALQAAADVSRRVFGKRVVFVKSSERLFGGLHRRGGEHEDTVLLDVDVAQAPMSVVGHELLHTLRTHNPKSYDDLVAAANRYLSKGAAKRYKDMIDARYRQAGSTGLPTDIAREEMFADIVGDLFSDSKFWDEFAQRSPSSFEKVATAVREFLDHLINVLTGQFKPLGSADYVGNLEKMREVVADAMAKYSESVPEGQKAPAEDLAAIPGTKIKGEKTPTLSKLLRNLTHEEQRKITDATAAKIIEQMSKLPSAKEMAAVAFAGRAKRGWYAQSADAISHVFGFDGPRFAALLAAMSPQTSVEDNLLNALNTWKNWVKAGRPTDREAILDVMGASVQGSRGRDSVLGAWINNSVRALTTDDPGTLIISGPKVNSFFRNLVGVVNEVTNDAWMANFALVDQTIFSGSLNALGTDPGKGSGYLAMSARVREAAAQLTKLTGETWWDPLESTCRHASLSIL